MRRRFGEAWDLLFAPPFAHRGLWAASGPPENSLAAFEAACEAGFGVELDVQLSCDGEAVVFHDPDLGRLTGEAGRLADHTAAQLGELQLSGTDEAIPTLAETLALIGRRAMVLIEIKTPYGEVGPLERRVCEVLIDHSGPTAVVGFNPYSHAWFADHHPMLLRGLNSDGYAGGESRRLAPDLRRALANLEQVELARPHFLALGLDVLPSARADERRAAGLPVVAWTVRSPEEWSKIRDHCDNLIFEGYAP